MFSLSVSRKIRALLVMIVFMQHLVFAIAQDWYVSAIATLTLVLRGDVAVGIMMLLSGYALAASWNNRQLNLVNDSIKRLIRIVGPMIGAYFLLYIVYLLGAGAWGKILSAMGYSWGYIQPIGMITTVGFDEFGLSFVNQLLGVNDQLLLVAWLLRYEIIFSIALIVLLFISQKLSWGDRTMAVTCVMVTLLSLLFDFGFGLMTAFSMGVTHFCLSKFSLYKKLTASRMLLLSVVVTSYTIILLSATNDVAWKAGLINSGMSWLAYLMTDARYAVYALMLPVVFCFVTIVSKSVAIAAGMDWLGERAYSSYLVGQIAIQLVAGAAFALKVYVPILIFIPMTVLLMLLLTDLFYRCIESKCKNVRLPSFQKHYFKKAV